MGDIDKLMFDIEGLLGWPDITCKKSMKDTDGGYIYYENLNISPL